MKAFKYLMSAVIVFMSFLFTACNEDEDEDELGRRPENSGGSSSGASDGTWYTAQKFATSADFEEINEAIDNHELLRSNKYSGDTYAEVESFISESGMWDNGDSNLGRLRWAGPRVPVNAIHIVDDTKIEIYILWLYLDSGTTNSNGERRIYHFNAGRHFGKMAYYGDEPGVYFYVKNGNKIVVSNGNMFAITDEGLIGDSGNVAAPFKPNF